MKRTHRISPKTLELANRAGSRDKRRMLIMGVGLAILVAGYFYSQFKANELRIQESADYPSAYPETIEYVQLPTIDGAAIDAMVSDASEEDRVLLERDAVDTVLELARNLTPAHFIELNSVELDETTAAELLAEPSKARGHAFTARGWIETLRVRRPGGGRPKEVHGKITLEDYTTVYFIVAEEPGGTSPVVETDFARIDGLFLKAYNDENRDKPGEWIQGPLIVGPIIQRSYRDLGEVSTLPIDTFLEVRDDDVIGGLTGMPHSALWNMLAFARDHDHESIEWESMPEIDNSVATEMLGDGSKWRGRAFRLPVTVLLGVWERAPGENPARMETITEGWIASWLWKGEARVLRFSMPGGMGDLRKGHKVRGTGFFLKNLAYEPEDGGLRLASMVVFDSLERFIPVENRSIDQIWIGVVIGTILITGVLFLLVTRDRKRAAQIQSKLVSRRRARRDQRSRPGPHDGAPSTVPPA